MIFHVKNVVKLNPGVLVVGSQKDDRLLDNNDDNDNTVTSFAGAVDAGR